jgi:hypothetical protein
MHCSVIRLSLYHYEEGGKLQVNAALKTFFKHQGFKWKTVTNDRVSRVEIMECATSMKEQCDPMRCQLYRKGLRREDVHREPFSVRIQSILAIGKGAQAAGKAAGDVQSVCGVLNGLLEYKRQSETIISSIG